MNRTDIKDEAEAQRDAINLEARSVCIARENDRFRQTCVGGDPEMQGRVVHSAGVHDLGFAFTARAYLAVRDFTSFTEDNDPHGEHDFGAMFLDGEKLFWKIDYYSDDSCTWGSEDPSDPARVYRVLTICLASEY